MDILHYTVDIKDLLATQERQTDINALNEKRIVEEGYENKKRLLKYVLPFLHGVYALHNNKCKRTNNTSTGREGLLGLSKIDLEKKLDFYVNTDSHHVWSNNYQNFCFSISNGKSIKIWLNSRRGAFQYTPHLEYSMLGFDDTYGSSVEGVLREIARYCARFSDEW